MLINDLGSVIRTYDGKKYKISVSHTDRYEENKWNQFSVRSRIFVSGQPKPTFPPHPVSYESNPENDLLWVAYNAAEVKIMKEVIEKAYPLIPRELLDHLRFSRKCGCEMCPCSPGFYAGQGRKGTYWVEMEKYVKPVPNFVPGHASTYLQSHKSIINPDFTH